MTNDRDILKELLVDEEDIVKDLADLVKQVKDIFVIEKSTGKIIFKDFGKLTDPQRICALLIGRYFATRLELLKDSSLGISEIANELGRPKTTLSKPLGDLHSKMYVEKLSNRKYRISYNRIKDVFEVYFGGGNGPRNSKGKD